MYHDVLGMYWLEFFRRDSSRLSGFQMTDTHKGKTWHTPGTLPTFDFESRTFDIGILRYRKCNFRYRRSENDPWYRGKTWQLDIEGFDIRYQISKIRETSISNVVTFVIDPVRYWRIFDIDGWNFDIDAVRYRRNIDIKDQNFDIVIFRYRRFIDISTNGPPISVYDIEALCFDIEFLVLRYRCFFVGSSLGCCSSYSVLDTDCGVHITLWINHRPWLMRRPDRPQPPQRSLHSAARPHQPQHRPQPPMRRSDQQSTSSWTWFQSHHGRRGGRQGSRRGALWTTTMVWTMGVARVRMAAAS